VENNNAGGTMKNHWPDRQSEILPDHTALATANVSSVLPPSKTTMLRSSIGYHKCVVNPIDRSKELLRVAVRDDENRQLLTSI
jgi:hypothetical protein